MIKEIVVKGILIIIINIIHIMMKGIEAQKEIEIRKGIEKEEKIKKKIEIKIIIIKIKIKKNI